MLLVVQFVFGAFPQEDCALLSLRSQQTELINALCSGSSWIISVHAVCDILLSWGPAEGFQPSAGERVTSGILFRLIIRLGDIRVFSLSNGG